MWRRIYVWATAALAAVFGTAMLARQLSWPLSKTWWDQTEPTLLPILFVLGSVAVGTTAINAVVLGEARRKDRRHRLIETYCRTLLISIDDVCSHAVPAISLSGHVWVISSRSLLNLFRKLPDALHRVATYKLNMRPSSSVTWIKGRGAVGRCWATEQILVADLAPLHASAAAGQAGFDALTDEERWGITWAEFQQTRAYWSILVFPLKDPAGKFLGCVSIDCSERGSYSCLQTAASSPGVETSVGLIMDALRE